MRSPLALPCFSTTRKTTRASFIKDPLKFVGRTSGLWPSTAKPKEGFAKEGHVKIRLADFLIAYTPSSNPKKPKGFSLTHRDLIE